MLDKSIHFVCFPNFFWVFLFSKFFFEFVCFPPFLPCFWPKNAFFGLKSRILMGNRQTKNISKKINCLSVWDASTYLGCTKSFKLEQIMIVQTHADDAGNWRNFRIFSKKAVIYTKLLLFLKKYENFSISRIIGVCLNNHNLLQFEAFGTAKVCRSISNTQTINFFRNIFGLSVSHQDTRF